MLKFSEKENDVCIFGIPMVELIKEGYDSPLREQGCFKGPYPAGDPGIFLNACALQGRKTVYIGTAGKDDFGAAFVNQMERHHVCTKYIEQIPDSMTGLSVVSKYSNGKRDFFFTLKSSAAAKLKWREEYIEVLKNVKVFHISGFACAVSESIAEACRRALNYIDDTTIVSFDPNYRKEMMAEKEFVKMCTPFFERSNLFLPSEGEAELFLGEGDERESCRTWSGRGKIIALKCGSKGSYAFEEGRTYYVRPYEVEEIDSTGAGDIFGGVFLHSLMRGRDVGESLDFAALAGAYAVTKTGLMNAAPDNRQLEEFREKMHRR
ncbi:sugar kinase [Mediterraneibacter sp. NSJ-55]|uniref:Sugar kinase n=1 Tax=Mediterraneibacter hominis TaxID=2763054 RepID=A0A923LI96_9FIRM|nr:sugar kinase [Mediterraneibacter hominis]MBC5688536.1 sugar kinase [Mediterraneibacter hominis]